jgi:hypothetical protein
MDSEFQSKDVITYAIGAFSVLLGWIWKSHDKRLEKVEDGKANETSVAGRFEDLVARLDRQDDEAHRRDAKLDQILSEVRRRR